MLCISLKTPHKWKKLLINKFLKMQTQVNIVADDMGNVIRQSQNNSEYGYVRLAQKRVTYGNNGWVKNSNLSTLLLGKMEDLQALDLNANTILPGKIVIKESLEPFNSTDPDRDLKYAGDTGIVCCVDGQPIYRKTFFTPALLSLPSVKCTRYQCGAFQATQKNLSYFLRRHNRLSVSRHRTLPRNGMTNCSHRARKRDSVMLS